MERKDRDKMKKSKIRNKVNTKKVEKAHVKKEHKRLTPSRCIRLFLVVLGILLFLWFLGPFTVAGILNIGNITGMLLSAIFTVYMGGMPAIHRGIKKLWAKTLPRVVVIILSGFILLCGVLAVVETGFMIKACTKTPEENATVVVLGCRVYGERASLMLRERLDAAYEYLNDHPKAVCVVSGGQGSGEDISEAECMYRYLVEKGIESKRIYKEDRSTSTEENMKFSLDIIKENNLDESVAIITNEFHLYRAGVIAKDCGLSFGTVPAKTAGWLFPTYYVRELYAILAEWIF